MKIALNTFVFPLDSSQELETVLRNISIFQKILKLQERPEP